MVAKAAFLTTRYGGYLHREVPEEDTELSHVGPDTPCGEYLRRFWQPICFSDELKDLPHPVKILGEELVVFRDQSGAVGLLELHCPHRGASLEYGLIDARGIRCCYHGWLFAPDGTILETPGEPAHSTLKERLCHGAYPTHEYGGMVFAYMGPPDRQPSFPVYDSFVRPGYRLLPGPKYFYPCNWLQIMENVMDPVHTAFLHTIVSGSQFTDEFGVLAGTGVRRDASGHDLHRDTAGRTERLGANGRSCSAEPAAGGPGLGDRPSGAWVQRSNAQPLDCAGGRHQHDVHRIPPCERDRRCHAPVVGRSQYYAPRSARRGFVRGRSAAARGL
jgi:phenylpropionate dioxygenase-like ring-hydroxylating dioxygenase large terminal subunit